MFVLLAHDTCALQMKRKSELRKEPWSCKGNVGRYCGVGRQACRHHCGLIVGCSSSRLWYRPAASGLFPPQLLHPTTQAHSNRPRLLLPLLRTSPPQQSDQSGGNAEHPPLPTYVSSSSCRSLHGTNEIHVDLSLRGSSCNSDRRLLDWRIAGTLKSSSSTTVLGIRPNHL